LAQRGDPTPFKRKSTRGGISTFESVGLARRLVNQARRTKPVPVCPSTSPQSNHGKGVCQADRHRILGSSACWLGRCPGAQMHSERPSDHAGSTQPSLLSSVHPDERSRCRAIGRQERLFQSLTRQDPNPIGRPGPSSPRLFRCGLLAANSMPLWLQVHFAPALLFPFSELVRVAVPRRDRLFSGERPGRQRC